MTEKYRKIGTFINITRMSFEMQQKFLKKVNEQ